jgi:hypothetical protein
LSARVRLSGVVPVALPVHEAFALFTPSGERAWVEGWVPEFPASPEDETEPGTVFEVGHRGRRSTWVVAACVPGRSITYARTALSDRAGLVRIECAAAEDGMTEARVAYDLTALTEEAEAALEDFAGRYAEFLEHWRVAIATAIARS